MVEVHKSSSWTGFDDIAGVESCHIVLETSPPDYVKKISRYLDSSVGRDEVSNEAAGADSDSGDSLFLTQKQVPEAVRSGRRKHHSERSKPISPRDIEGSDGGTLSSDSHEESKTAKDERLDKKKFSVTSLPKFSFPFLSGRKGKARSTQLSNLQNKTLHNSAMGGFFKCLIEDYEGGYDVQWSLPTVDVEGEYISPLSEEEEDRPEDEDIKVVERKRFVFLSKAKSQQTWCNPLKQQGGKADNPRQETSQGGQHKTAKGSVTREKPLSTNTNGSDDGESCGVLVEKGRNEQCIISDGNFLAQKETPKKNRPSPRRNKKILFQQKATEEELCNDSDATVCEPPELQSSPRQYTHNEEETTTAAEPQTHVLHTDDLSQTEQTEDEPASQSLLCNLPDIISGTNNDRVSNEIRVKKRKKKKKDKGAHERVEEETGQSQEEPEGLHAAVQETASLSVDNSAGPPAAQTSDELEFNGRNCIKNSHAQEEGGIPDSKQKKKKRKKDKSLAENVGQEVDGNLESDVRTADSENDGKKKKKKKRKINGEDVEQLQSSTVAEAPNDDAAAIKKKKKKRKKEAPSQDGEEGVDVSLCNGAITSEDRTGTSPKKKKTTSDEVVISYTPEEKEKVEDEDYTQETEEGLEDQNTELVTKKKKKKKKKKMSERSGWNITEDNVTQSDYSVSVQEKEKKRTSSFLIADAKENNARTHEEQNSSSQSVDAEKPVGAGDFQTESAEIARNSVESNDGVRKKKKKRKMSVEQGSVEKEHKQDFEEANKTKEKKKRVRNESESVNPVERFQNAADEGYPPPDEDAVVKKKKKKCKNKLCLVTATEDAESEKSTPNTCSFKEIEQAPQETSGNQASNEMRDRKNQKKIKSAPQLEGNSLIKTAELEPQENKKKRKKERNKQSSDPKIISSSPMLSETLISMTEKSPSDHIMKNKHTKVKRRLLNRSEDFL
ncbi:uncharacterized protein [Pagrus major]|uniref:uncharacterized protein n=1 Tax=Pagrus major TaxID=143350 RepID=UPI003CC84F92